MMGFKIAFFVTNEAPRTNSSKEIKTSGWLGTTNGWNETAHVEYDSLQEAIDAINKILGDDQRPYLDHDGDYEEGQERPLYVAFVGFFPING